MNRQRYFRFRERRRPAVWLFVFVLHVKEAMRECAFYCPSVLSFIRPMVAAFGLLFVLVVHWRYTRWTRSDAALVYPSCD